MKVAWLHPITAKIAVESVRSRDVWRIASSIFATVNSLPFKTGMVMHCGPAAAIKTVQCSAMKDTCFSPAERSRLCGGKMIIYNRLSGVSSQIQPIFSTQLFGYLFIPIGIFPNLIPVQRTW